MVSDNILSFSKAKKRAKQVRKEQQASENRAKFGRNKAEKNANAARETVRKSQIDSHKIEDK